MKEPDDVQRLWILSRVLISSDGAPVTAARRAMRNAVSALMAARKVANKPTARNLRELRAALEMMTRGE